MHELEAQVFTDGVDGVDTLARVDKDTDGHLNFSRLFAHVLSDFVSVMEGQGLNLDGVLVHLHLPRNLQSELVGHEINFALHKIVASWHNCIAVGVVLGSLWSLSKVLLRRPARLAALVIIIVVLLLHSSILLKICL